MRLPRLLTGTAIVAVLAGTAACGLQSVEPKLELRDAASSFGSASAGSMRFSIGSTAADYRTFERQANAESTDGSSGDSMSDADLQKLLASRFDLSFDGGSDKKSTTDDSSQVIVHVGDTDAGEIRSVDQTLYARADISGLVAEFPDMKSGVDSFRASLDAGPDAGGPPAAIATPAAAALDGKWLSLDMHPDSWVGQQLAKTTKNGLSTDYLAKVKALAGKAFGGGAVAVQRLDSDDKLGDHLVATANLRKVYGNVRGDVASLFTGSAGSAIAKELPEVTAVPDRTMSVSFWVKDGKFTRVELDAAQFLDKPAGHLVLRMDALSKQKITAPSGAVVVDPKAIADQVGVPLDQLLSGVTPGSSDATFSTTDPSSAVGGIMAGPLSAQTAASFLTMDIRQMAAADGASPSLSYLSRARAQLLDMDNSIVVTQVGRRIQVAYGGHASCVTLPPTADVDGTITPGLC